MQWNREQIDYVAKAGAVADYKAFERIGLTEIANARVLDIGCFDGFNTYLKLAPYGNIESVVGIDPCEEAVEMAKASGADARFSWVHASLEDFDAQGQLFDVVYLSHTFQHLANKEVALSKVYSLMAPGAFLVIKTVDDSAKLSYPDPDGVMKRVMEYYDSSIRPFVAHTANTDRNNGAKCYALLRAAGFVDVHVDVLHADTCGLNVEEREKLFARLTYFRSGAKANIDADVKHHMQELLDAWHDIFLDDGYFFDSPTFMFVSRKPGGAGAACMGSAARGGTVERVAGWELSPMAEEDLSNVMEIELASFPNPWTPIAYAMEIRHNPAAHYVVARDESGLLCGYVGWWAAGDEAIITRIVSDSRKRRQGLGRVLLEHACTMAAQSGAQVMRLDVRESNVGARVFYGRMGFAECGREPEYFDSPVEDAVSMYKTIEL